jgi:5'(3')-deoxyribonucleotidase
MNMVGDKARIEDYKRYEFGKYHNLTNDQFKECVVNSQVFRLLQPRPRAIEAINMLNDKGYDVVIITSRGSFANARVDTLKWLEAHSADVLDVKIVNPDIEDKSDVYLKYGVDRIVGLVDDAVHNLKDAERHGVRPICISRPWNELFGRDDNRFDSIFALADSLPYVK